MHVEIYLLHILEIFSPVPSSQHYTRMKIFCTLQNQKIHYYYYLYITSTTYYFFIVIHHCSNYFPYSISVTYYYCSYLRVHVVPWVRLLNTTNTSNFSLIFSCQKNKKKGRCCHLTPSQLQ